MRFTLTEGEMNECTIFSERCAENQQEIEFGEEDTNPRTPEEIARDNLIGKIAEVGFKKLMERDYNIFVNLDFEYYPRGVWDKQDAIINGWRIDVKGTRSGGKWLLIEWNKLKFRKKENLLSHFYIMASVGWNRECDKPDGKVDIIGYSTLGQLKIGYPGTMVLDKNDLIPNTKTHLQSKNFARKFDNLENNWDKFANIVRKTPEDTSAYNGIQIQ